jgi:hypothetical protein
MKCSNAQIDMQSYVRQWQSGPGPVQPRPLTFTGCDSRPGHPAGATVSFRHAPRMQGPPPGPLNHDGRPGPGGSAARLTIANLSAPAPQGPRSEDQVLRPNLRPRLKRHWPPDGNGNLRARLQQVRAADGPRRLRPISGQRLIWRNELRLIFVYQTIYYRPFVVRGHTHTHTHTCIFPLIMLDSA